MVLTKKETKFFKSETSSYTLSPQRISYKSVWKKRRVSWSLKARVIFNSSLFRENIGQTLCNPHSWAFLPRLPKLLATDQTNSLASIARETHSPLKVWPSEKYLLFYQSSTIRKKGKKSFLLCSRNVFKLPMNIGLLPRGERHEDNKYNPAKGAICWALGWHSNRVDRTN